MDTESALYNPLAQPVSSLLSLYLSGIATAAGIAWASSRGRFRSGLNSVPNHRGVSRKFAKLLGLSMAFRFFLISFAFSFAVTGCVSVSTGSETPAPEPVVAPETAPAEERPSEPDSEEYTTGEKLAILDDNWSEFDSYNRRFEQVLDRCPANSEQQLGDSLYLATQLLDERGITETSLWAMEGLLSAVEPSMGADLDCREVLAGLVALRAEEGP